MLKARDRSRAVALLPQQASPLECGFSGFGRGGVVFDESRPHLRGLAATSLPLLQARGGQ